MQHLKDYFWGQLAQVYSQAEIAEIFYILLEKTKKISRQEYFLADKIDFSEQEISDFQLITARLKNGEPIQYITEETEFYQLRFAVNKEVLIPRPETEEMVEWILSENKTAATVLDAGTGSGCIAITLAKKNPLFNVTATDISTAALALARENAKLNNVEISFLKNDILKVQKIDKNFDIIVSNPPYIPENEKITMHKTVTGFEPHLALFVPAKSPLIFYEKIIQFANNQLNTNGKLYFEIHRDQGRQISELLKKSGFKNIILKKDISGNDRMVSCTHD
jgi:release factor glutamine methyltransferase